MTSGSCRLNILLDLGSWQGVEARLWGNKGDGKAFTSAFLRLPPQPLGVAADGGQAGVCLGSRRGWRWHRGSGQPGAKLWWGGPSCEPALRVGRVGRPCGWRWVQGRCQVGIPGGRGGQGQPLLWDLGDTPGRCWNPNIQLLPFVPCEIVNIPGSESTFSCSQWERI